MTETWAIHRVKYDVVRTPQHCDRALGDPQGERDVVVDPQHCDRDLRPRGPLLDRLSPSASVAPAA